MQLTIEVLPAPLGPIIENSSPSLTPKLTSVSARTPPKRSDTPRTSKACSTHSLPGAISGAVISNLQWSDCSTRSSEPPSETKRFRTYLNEAAGRARQPKGGRHAGVRGNQLDQY